MKIIKKRSLDPRSIDALILPVFKRADLDRIMDRFPESRERIKTMKFKTKPGRSLVFHSLELNTMVVIAALDGGKDALAARKGALSLVKLMRHHRMKRPAVQFTQPVDFSRRYLVALVDYLYIHSYRFQSYKRKESRVKPVSRIQLVFERGTRLDNPLIAEREAVAESVLLVRELVNEIPEKINPDTMVEACRDSARDHGLEISVLRADELREAGMAGLLAVGRESPYQPALVRLEYSPENHKGCVALVGKGITFDSGGLNIKISNYMEEMKCDMAGAATVLGIITAAARLQLPVRVIAYAALAENMPGRGAYKPGDIITYRNNKSVEIVNTDAEGRLVLADALIEAQKDKPDYIVEFSTLTGAIVVALGDIFAGLMCTAGRLSSALKRSAEASGDALWEMPLFEDYRESIKSGIADLKNADYKGASSIKAGLFLSEFTGKIPFAHIDIAGTAFVSRTTALHAQEGATGYGVRLLVDFLEQL